ncbi:MAG TPA: YbhB/YbcL family Raf kinase inhibitor-like protein [Polyangia bacterium]
MTVSSVRVTSGSRRVAWLAAAVLAFVACGGGGPRVAGAPGGGGTTGASGTGAVAGTTGGGGASGDSGVAGAPGVAGGGAGATGTAGAAGGAGAAGQGGGGGVVDAGSGVAPEAGSDAPAGPFTLTSSAFIEGMEIPLPYKCAEVQPAGMNQSPPLAWTPGPPGTMSYAVTLNHAAADNSAHWALWDIPATMTSLAANVDHVAMPPLPAGARQGTQNLDGFTGIGYLGPCPQAVGARQTYRFTVWALKVATLGGVTSSSTTAAAQTAIKNAALPGGSATLTGTQIRSN